MPSVKNPNTVGRNRSAARVAKARKVTLQGRKTAALPTRVAKADVRRGARAGLLPTSGPNAPLSKKKQRKVEKQLAHAIRRKKEAEEKRAEDVMGAEEAVKNKKELKQDRNAAIEAMGKMDIS